MPANRTSPRKRARTSTRARTKTSPFGAPGRVNHDASAFYAGKLYNHLRDQDSKKFDLCGSGGTEHHLASENIQIFDQIFCKSSEQMSELPGESVHLVVTSPPYNVGKEYDQDLSLADYLAFLQRVWGECLRALVDGGRLCINVANLGRKPYIPLHAFILQGVLELGFHMRGEIIWNKAASASASTAWGSWQSAANPTLRDVHEYILVFSKGSFSRKKPAGQPDTISRDEFLETTKSVWTFPTETARKVGHPAPFPVELPRRLIQLYTFAGDLVLDPFMGSGQTAIAALRTGRRFVGYETDPGYVKLAQDRIKQDADFQDKQD
jgi:site-specific DNA-methyltransferase (adenine-specific)